MLDQWTVTIEQKEFRVEIDRCDCSLIGPLNIWDVEDRWVPASEGRYLFRNVRGPNGYFISRIKKKLRKAFPNAIHYRDCILLDDTDFAMIKLAAS